MDDYDYLFKILIIGEMGVGKSSLLLRYTDNMFDMSYISTIGVDFKIKTIMIDDKRVKIQLWDTAGQERFRTITQSYYRGATAVCIVFDLTNKNSYDGLEHWFQDIKENTNMVEKILIGNKADLVENREISEDTVLEFAKVHDIDYVETSAKNSKNIDYMFEKLFRKLLQNKKLQMIRSPVVEFKAKKFSSCFCGN